MSKNMIKWQRREHLCGIIFAGERRFFSFDGNFSKNGC
ncbi:hypothetical protein B4099_3584 [Heyndrickxia coagulans]|uniref:Uncharacterized protein n=1 Tax=Heyndrickxia coagulans TaxID=1398 RepID=A0A150JW51_HEYCO|nr:hypothetical protein B4099_3584 [Heyndrickxia coagulans]